MISGVFIRVSPVYNGKINSPLLLLMLLLSIVHGRHEHFPQFRQFDHFFLNYNIFVYCTVHNIFVRHFPSIDDARNIAFLRVCMSLMIEKHTQKYNKEILSY